MTRAILIGGIVASLIMGMWEMIVEAFIGEGFFAPVVYIGATVMRGLQDTTGGPGLGPTDPLGIILGLMGHMMNSVVLAAVFTIVIARMLRGTVTLAVAGMVYGLVIFAVMWYVVLPLIDPVMLQLNFVVFLLAHAMWGGALGVLNGWFGASDAAPLVTAGASA
ncbi:MAG: hypothetical protein CL878_01540 [Dehalococcoidia bacterium]|nr:hypothetical protein [Dehalococcoidia bacterium]